MSCPTAKLTFDQGACRRWTIQWPSTTRKCGKSYRATTYPGTDHVYVETMDRRREISPLVGRRIMPEIRTALIDAGAFDLSASREVTAP